MDMWTTGYLNPILEANQDIKNAEGKVEDGVTTIKFTRARDTGDSGQVFTFIYIILLFYYFTILLFCYFTILLFYYFTISLFHYFTISLFHYFTILLFIYYFRMLHLPMIRDYI